MPVASSGRPGTGSRRTRLRRTATAALAAAAVAVGLGAGVAGAPANAADAPTSATISKALSGPSYWYRVPRNGSTVEDISSPSVYSLVDGQVTVTVYPLEFGQSVPNPGSTGYHLVDWDRLTPVDRHATVNDAPPTRVERWKKNDEKIRWILANSALQKGAESVLQAAGIIGVAPGSEFSTVRDATASAIWNLSSGAELFAISGGMGKVTVLKADDPVLKLYQWLLKSADDSTPLPEPAVTFNATSRSGTSGTTLPSVRLDTTSDKSTIKATLPAGVALKLTADGKTTSHEGNVEVTAPGTLDLSLEVDAGTTPSSVDVTATADVPAMPVGSLWSQATSGQIQNPFAAGDRGSSTELITNRLGWGVELPSLVLAASSTVRLSDTTSFSWKAPDAPPPSTPTDPPTVPVDPPTTTPTTTPTDSPTPTPGPTPTTTPPQTPPPSTPTTPPPPPSHKPPSSKPPKPTKPAVISRTFQVDRYTARTSAQARALAALDDDRRLTWREDRRFWGSSRFQFVTVRVPVNATKATILKAVNAQTNAAIGDVTTTERLTKATRGRSYVVAWELGTGASTRHPWGPRTDIAQRFLARS